MTSQPAAPAKGAHTPEPWFVHDVHTPESGTFVNVAVVDSVAIIARQDGDDVGTPHGDAEFIVRAVNSHAELVSALRAVDQRLSGIQQYSQCKTAQAEAASIRHDIRAALAKAGER